MTNLEKFSIIAILITLNYAFILGFCLADYLEKLNFLAFALLWLSSACVFKLLVVIASYFIDFDDIVK